MEKASVDKDTSNVVQHESSPRISHQIDDPKPDYSSKATNKTTLTDYLVVSPLGSINHMHADKGQRIFTYSTLSDRIFLALAALAEIGTGVTLPLMNIIFGKLLKAIHDPAGCL
jgi:hypothetical protein